MYSHLPQDLKKCIGIVCNGELVLSASLEKRIKECGLIIGVDGGLNACASMHLLPTWIVGDFDSVNPEILTYFSQSTNILRYTQAKDFTDLEIAIKKAKEMHPASSVFVFGGLGGRMDHTLTNLFFLMRDPGHLFLESENQLIFAVNAHSGSLFIPRNEFQTLAVYPYNGPTKELRISMEKKEYHYCDFNRENSAILPLISDCYLSIGQGEVLVLLDKRIILIDTDCHQKMEKEAAKDISTLFLLERLLHSPDEFLTTHEHVFHLCGFAQKTLSKMEKCFVLLMI
jgi:thiamine pyrophosphokinase